MLPLGRGREREGPMGKIRFTEPGFGAVTLRTIELFASRYEMVSPLIVADQFIPLLGWVRTRIEMMRMRPRRMTYGSHAGGPGIMHRDGIIASF